MKEEKYNFKGGKILIRDSDDLFGFFMNYRNVSASLVLTKQKPTKYIVSMNENLTAVMSAPERSHEEICELYEKAGVKFTGMKITGGYIDYSMENQKYVLSLRDKSEKYGKADHKTIENLLKNPYCKIKTEGE